MSAERRRAAALDGRHHLHLVKADVNRVNKTPSRAINPDVTLSLRTNAHIYN